MALSGTCVQMEYQDSQIWNLKSFEELEPDFPMESGLQQIPKSLTRCLRFYAPEYLLLPVTELRGLEQGQ